MKITRIDPTAHNEALSWVEDQLSSALERAVIDEDLRPFLLLLLSDENEREGGLVAYKSWDWLVIDSLVVNDAQRSQGWGQALVQKAEQLGEAMGCTRATLETYTAQVFFENLGYEVVLRFLDYPPGGSFVRMNRAL